MTSTAMSMRPRFRGEIELERGREEKTRDFGDG